MVNPRAPAAKRALLIGIDRYVLEPEVVTPLTGCSNDVELMRWTLVKRYGFDPKDITVLKDADATAAGITKAFEDLIEHTGENDIVVVHYAGHGSYIPNAAGTEASGSDSTIVPVDSGRERNPSTDITDDTINGWLTEIGRKTPFTTLVFDSCHSGTITRDIFEANQRSVPPDTRRAVSHPARVASDAPRPMAPSSRGDHRGAGPSPAEPDTYVVISGCRDDEKSFEYRSPQGVAHGALTWFLLQELQRPGRRSYRDLFEVVAPLVTRFKGQHPQLAGRADAEVFGVHTLPPMQYVLVTGLTPEGNAIEIGAGAGQRVTVGSLYDIYPGGGPLDSGPLGRVRVTHVYAVHADAKAVGKTPITAFPSGSRAVEVEHAYGDLRLGVLLAIPGKDVGRPEAVALVDALKRSRKIELLNEKRSVKTPSKADGGVAVRPEPVVLHLIAPRAKVGAADPVPRLGHTDEYKWVMADGKGDPVGPVKMLRDHAQVAKNLETLANYRDTLSLENPDPTTDLPTRFNVQLMRRVPGASASPTMKPEEFAWVEALPDARGRIVFEEGEFIGFRVASAHDEPMFINLLSLGVDGEIGVIYPGKSDASQMLAAGSELNIRNQSGKGFRVTFPKSYPFLPDSSHDQAVEGEDMVKLFVTEREARFEGIQQGGQRSLGASRSALEGLMRRAFDKGPPAEATRGLDLSEERSSVTVPVSEKWTTVTRAYLVRKSGSLSAPAAIAHAAGSSATAVATSTASLTDTPARAAVARRLSGPGLTMQQSYQIVQPPSTSGARSVWAKTRVEVPNPAPGHGQMLLATDESGMMSWHFPSVTREKDTGSSRDAAITPAAERFYDVPVPPAPTRVPGQPEGRSMASYAMRKLLEVVAFPLIEDGVELLTDLFLPTWEAKRQPYRVRTFTPDDYAQPGGVTVDRAELTKGPALLMIHGTFSSAHASFGALDKSAVERLHRKYGGRVFAFNHLTLSHDPRQNVNWLLNQLPDTGRLDIDIVCHSRGGLVSRVLAEQQDDLPRAVRVGKVVFVGSPNAGTLLADPRHVGKFIDAYTNLLSFVPPNGVTEVLEGIITAAKVVAVGMVKGLRGLQSMNPSGKFITALNARVTHAADSGETQYFALSSDFSPRPDRPALSALLANRVMDGVFEQAKNDLVVPTDSVFAENGARGFPITQAKTFSGADALSHTEFFANDAVRRQLLEWLGA